MLILRNNLVMWKEIIQQRSFTSPANRFSAIKDVLFLKRLQDTYTIKK